MAATTTLVQLTAPTHFSIKLTTSNYLVWKHRLSLFSLDLMFLVILMVSHLLLQNIQTRRKTLSIRLIILNALLGSCSDILQSVISSTQTATDVWKRLVANCVATSRGHVVSLKGKLVKNPKERRSIVDFLRDMRSIADDLAIAQSPVSEEDFVVHVITQLRDEFNPIAAALRCKDSPISICELADMLTDYERLLQEND